MGARASTERQQCFIFEQIAALDPNTPMNRNKRTLFERLLLMFNNTGGSELRLNQESAYSLLVAIARFRDPNEANAIGQAERLYYIFLFKNICYQCTITN